MSQKQMNELLHINDDINNIIYYGLNNLLKNLCAAMGMETAVNMELFESNNGFTPSSDTYQKDVFLERKTHSKLQHIAETWGHIASSKSNSKKLIKVGVFAKFFDTFIDSSNDFYHRELKISSNFKEFFIDSDLHVIEEIQSFNDESGFLNIDMHGFTRIIYLFIHAINRSDIKSIEFKIDKKEVDFNFTINTASILCFEDDTHSSLLRRELSLFGIDLKDNDNFNISIEFLNKNKFEGADLW